MRFQNAAERQRRRLRGKSGTPNEKRKGCIKSFDDLTAEQKVKARAAKTPEEILALAKEDGYELSVEELSAIAGGSNSWRPKDCNQVCYHKNCDTWV